MVPTDAGAAPVTDNSMTYEAAAVGGLSFSRSSSDCTNELFAAPAANESFSITFSYCVFGVTYLEPHFLR